MTHRAVRAGDVPTAPAPAERRAIVGVVGTELSERQTVGRDEHAARDQSRHVQRAVGLMTRQAALTTIDEGTRLRLLIERVEDDALLGIVDREFEKRRAADV